VYIGFAFTHNLLESYTFVKQCVKEAMNKPERAGTGLIAETRTYFRRAFGRDFGSSMAIEHCKQRASWKPLHAVHRSMRIFHFATETLHSFEIRHVSSDGSVQFRVDAPCMCEILRTRDAPSTAWRNTTFS
jgi:hypothetical protein